MLNEPNELKHLISLINESCQALWLYYFCRGFMAVKLCNVYIRWWLVFCSSNKLETEINQLKTSAMQAQFG